MSKIEEVLENRERIAKLDAILLDESVKYYYIKKGSYYRPGSCGYTEFKYRAGVFTTEEAVSEARWCNEITIIPIDMDVHNKMIGDEIKDLQTRLLK